MNEASRPGELLGEAAQRLPYPPVAANLPSTFKVVLLSPQAVPADPLLTAKPVISTVRIARR